MFNHATMLSQNVVLYLSSAQFFSKSTLHWLTLQQHVLPVCFLFFSFFLTSFFAARSPRPILLADRHCPLPLPTATMVARMRHVGADMPHLAVPLHPYALDFHVVHAAMRGKAMWLHTPCCCAPCTSLFSACMLLFLFFY